MKTDTDPRTTVELKAEMTKLFKENLEFLVDDTSNGSITMTDATESIWGSSGRGNPRAVRIIETLAEYGYLKITGGKRRRVEMTEPGLDLATSLPLLTK